MFPKKAKNNRTRPPSPPSGPSPAKPSALPGRDLGPRAKLALALAAVVTLVGGCLWGYAAASAPEPPTPVAARSGDSTIPGSPLAPRGFAPGDSGMPDWMPDLPGGEPPPGAEGDGKEAPDGQRLIDDASPAIFTLGFSFMVAFAIGYAVRTFVKISLIASGAFLLALFGLDYAGVITINMTALEGHYDSFTAFLSREFESFRSFVTGALPSAASAAAGLVFGFRKK